MYSAAATASGHAEQFVRSTGGNGGLVPKTTAASLAKDALRSRWRGTIGFLALAVTVVLVVVGLAYLYWRRRGKRRAASTATTESSSVVDVTFASAEKSNVAGAAEPAKPEPIDQQSSAEQPAAEQTEQPAAEAASVRKARDINVANREFVRAEREALKRERDRLRAMKQQIVQRRAQLRERAATLDESQIRSLREDVARLNRELTEARQAYNRRRIALAQRRRDRKRKRRDAEAEGQVTLARRRRRSVSGYYSTASATKRTMDETSDYSSDDDDASSVSSVSSLRSSTPFDRTVDTAERTTVSRSAKRERERQLLRNALSPLIAAPLADPTVAETQLLGTGGLDEATALTIALDEAYTRHLDLRAARLAVYDKQTDDPPPSDLRRYKTLPAKDTGVYGKWSKNERQLVSMISMLSQGLRHAYRYPQERASIDAAEDFTRRFKQAYEAAGSNGDNGTIVSRLPTAVTAQMLDLLAVYLLLPPRYTDRDAARTAADLTLAIAVTPTQYRYPTVRLSDAEAVRSFAAWLLAAYRRHGGAFDAQLDATVDGASLLADARLPLRQSEFEPGLHLDGGYFSRSRAPSFEMLRAAADPQIEYTFHLIRAETNPRVAWERVHRITSHRTVAVGLCGFNVPTQLGSLCTRQTLTNANATNGIEVIPSCRYLRFFTPVLQFAVCGQASGKAYFDATLMDRRAPQYAVQYRNVHYADSSVKFAYPANGLLNRAGDKEPTNHDGRALDEVEYPDEAVSFVAKWERYGVMYQAYRIEKLAPADVREIVLVDSLEERITIIAEITNLSPEETLTYHFTDRHRIEPGAKRCFKTQFEMTPNGREMTCTTGDSDFPSFPLRVDDRFAVHVFHGPENGPLGDAVLMVDQQPRVCSPLSRPAEKAIIEVPMPDGRVATFAHHPAENQWLFSSYL